ncbi:MAG: hypothetical protein M1818_001743 [Claussenomyces sp. TS43310]|nr:MAG: hypothetical protein M1818_001743 [Claussenomyces sp. TS43310]
MATTGCPQDQLHVMRHPSSPASEQKKANTKKARTGTAQKTKPATPPKLFQQLGRHMVDDLVKGLQSPHGCPTLVDRLKYPDTTTTTTTTITTTFETTSVQTSDNSNALQTRNPSGSPILASAPCAAKTSRPAKTRGDNHHGSVFTLDDFAAVEALNSLIAQYSRVSHMGVLDSSYNFFVTQAKDAALYFKVKEHICIVGGDPLCPPELLPVLLDQFAQYRRQQNWGIIFVGASDDFVAYAKQHSWTTLQFGNERVLNPLTNSILHEKMGKRIASQNRQLLHPEKKGITLGVYSPSAGRKPELQRKLVAVYDEWRDARNRSDDPQAFITVYDPFAIPNLMTYIYTMDRCGNPNGFAALRQLGANNGFHVDPCVAIPSAPRGITDLLIFSSMALLHEVGCSYLSFGYEPLTQPGEITGMRPWLQSLTRHTHKFIFKGLKVSGKKGYHDKWCPDDEQSSGLHIVFPSGTPGLQDISAVIGFANISIKSVILARVKKSMQKSKTEARQETKSPEKTLEVESQKKMLNGKSETHLELATTK